MGVRHEEVAPQNVWAAAGCHGRTRGLSGLRNAVALAILNLPFLPFGDAQAACTGINTTSVSCSSPPNDTGAILTSYSGNTTATLTNWVMTNGSFRIQGPGANSLYVLNGNGITLTGGTLAGYSAIHTASSTLGGNTAVTISNSSVEVVQATTHGIGSHANNAIGNASLTVTDTRLTAPNAASTYFGLVVSAQGSGSSTLVVTGGSVTTAGTGYAVTAGSITGNVSATLTNGVITSTGSSAAGLDAHTGGAGTVTVRNANAITTSGSSAGGINAASVNGAISVSNSGTITINGSNARGIRATATGSGNATIDNAGAITLNANTASTYPALYATTTSGDAAIINSGAITVKGSGGGAASSGALAIASGTGNASISMTGGTVANTGTGAAARGLEAQSTGGGNVSINVLSGSVATGSGEALAAWNSSGNIRVDTAAGTTLSSNATAVLASGASAARGTSVQVVSQSIISAGNFGIRAVSTQGAPVTVNQTGGSITSGTNAIDAASTGDVKIINSGNLTGGGATGAAISLFGATQTVSNAGTLGALSDRAIVLDSNGSTGSANVSNASTGVVTGSISAVGSRLTLDNAGTWNLRRFADTTGGGVRDTYGVAVSDLGSAAGNSVNNTGTLALLSHDGTATTLDATGQYLPFGNTNNAIALHSPAQGQILGAAQFINSGIIDLQANASAGDVLVISAGHTPGANGGGVFVSNGGLLRVNTVLNAGGANSVSDVLVVDSTSVAAGGPTGIAVKNAGGAGGLTVSNGIPVVQVLNPNASAAAAFSMSGRAVAGPYEYRLRQGNNPSDGNWYLHSEKDPDPPAPPLPPSPPGPPGPGPSPRPAPEPLYRPEIAAYLANQRLVAQMFVHTMHDRMGEPQFAESQGFEPDGGKRQAVWLRTTGTWEKTNSRDGNFGASTDLFLMQAGGELMQWKLLSETSRLHVGAMLGYGIGNTSASADGNPFSAKGRVEGYSAGLYATWFQNDATKLGAYVDTWMQYGWFNNRVDGQYLPRVDYDSKAWSVSAETGYAFKLHGNWILEPQAQIIYTHANNDGVTEESDTRVGSSNSRGTTTRIGVRTFSTFDMARGRQVQPFATVNWWRTNADSSVSLNQLPFGTLYPKDRYELKLGVHANFTRGWTGWVNMSGSWGAQDYHQYAGRMGVKYVW
ncbi:autotransporter outer membrane beta-barrel domain-containing protein [Achromobacter seleniivolatilans]|uniref:Autotransporter outer membrane beta-barrel domain-containing protein n=1 Tax=Achromobacter seleniivolatilans TaxID=3047478 RepID=A0ABY9M4S3_9BURK|nr:autotransporter outer membrane beta-barrel domain-containing protein [Achromobacter sp. R39]WMD20807.1 autotransporter outer membrane beta-barrel domain-containing protein [Achromobacter sp. R39]